MRRALAVLLLAAAPSIARADDPPSNAPGAEPAEPAEPPPVVAAPAGPPGTAEPAHVLHAPVLSAPVAPGSRVPALAMTGVTLALVAATGITYFHATNQLDKLDNGTQVNGNGMPITKSGQRGNLNLAFGLGVATVISGAITGYLWTRAEAPPRHILIYPTGYGGAVGYGGAF